MAVRYGPVFATAPDATGGVLGLEVPRPGVTYAPVVDLVESPEDLADALDLPWTRHFRHGFCWGLLVPDGSRLLVVVMGREGPDLEGDGVVAGRLSDEDTARWASLWGGRAVRVSVLLEATPGLLGLEVRFRTTPIPITEPPPEPVAMGTAGPAAVAPVPEPPAVVEPQPEAHPVVGQEPVTAVLPEPDVVPEPQPIPEPDVVPEPEPLTAALPEPDVVPEPEPVAEPVGVPEPETVLGPEPVIAALPEPEVVPGPDMAPESATVTAVVAEPAEVPEPVIAALPEPEVPPEPLAVTPVEPPVPALDLGRLGPPAAPAAWYVDPWDETSWRWWDGSRWTADAAPRTDDGAGAS